MSFKTVMLFVCATFLFCTNNSHAASITFGSKYSTIKINSGAACFIEHPLYLDQGVINREEFGVIRGAPIIFNNATMIDCGNKTKITATINTNNYTFVLAGDNRFYGRSGTIYEPINVSGKNNLIAGNLTLCGNINLLDSNTSVSVDLISNISGNIYLNGGMLCLMENSLKFNDNKKIFGPGTVYESASKLIFGSTPLTFSENLSFVEAEDIQFNSKITLAAQWTFSGNATIDAGLNSLDLDDSGKIVVNPGSSVLLKNMNIYNLKDSNICCLDNTATITLQNVNLYLSADFTFSIGRFLILDNVSIFGENKFIYQSPMQSIILSKSMLTLDNWLTFSYDPGCMRKDLIKLQDYTSVLHIDGATLHTTLTGMQLTKGSLSISRNSYFSSEKNVNLDEGITLGNDMPEDDIYCEISKAAKLSLISGSIKYKNTIPSSWSMENNLSAIDIYANCTLYLYQNLNIEPGVLNYRGRGGFFYMPGKKLDGSVNVEGYIDYLEIS